MAFDNYKDRRFQIHWKQLKYHMPIKHDNKNNHFCTPSEKYLLKDEKWIINGLDTQ